MSRRKDRERFLRLKQQNPGYLGFRGGAPAAVSAPAPELVSVLCTVCRRVPVESISGTGEDYVCIRCQDLPGPDHPGQDKLNP